MTWKEYQGILRKDKIRFNSAVSGGDTSVDPNPGKDPNNFLAPLASWQGLKEAMIIIAIAIIIYWLIVTACGGKNYDAPDMDFDYNFDDINLDYE